MSSAIVRPAPAARFSSSAALANAIRRRRLGRRRRRLFVLAHDEAAADRQPALLGDDRAGRVARRERQRVGVARRRIDEVEHDVGGGIESDRLAAGERQRPASRRLRRPSARRGRDRRVSGRSPLRPRIIALSVAWPLPVKASEPKSVTRTLRRAPAPSRQRVGEGGRRLHRPDRMRRRRPEADLEEVEDADQRALAAR